MRLLLTNGAFAHLPESESAERVAQSFAGKTGDVGQPLIAAGTNRGMVYVVREHVVAILGAPDTT
jgi:hypothetical protein